MARLNFCSPPSVTVRNSTAPYAFIKDIRILDHPGHENPLHYSRPAAISVNPKTHTIYVMDGYLGLVYAMNSKCIIESDSAHKVSETH
jgi:hypothetical protein